MTRTEPAPCAYPTRPPGHHVNVFLTSSFHAQACAPWGNVCVVAGTHYIPIALPSILASLFLLLPLVAIAAKLQASGQEVTRAQMKIEELETEIRVMKERL